MVDQFFTSDVLFHTWDLARATGQDDTLDVLELVGAGALETGAGAVPRDLGVIAPLAAGATAPSPKARAFDLQWYMINGERPGPAAVKIFDAALVLHALLGVMRLHHRLIRILRVWKK